MSGGKNKNNTSPPDYLFCLAVIKSRRAEENKPGKSIITVKEKWINCLFAWQSPTSMADVASVGLNSPEIRMGIPTPS